MAKDQSDILKEILKKSKNPKAIEQAQAELADAAQRKAEIVAQMKGSITAPIAKSTSGLSEVTPTKETGVSEVASDKLSTGIQSLLKESKDQNSNLKKLIKLNEKSIEDNSELFSRLEKTLNALLDNANEQGRKSLGKPSSDTGNASPQGGGGKPTNEKPDTGGGSKGLGVTDLLEMGAGAFGAKKGYDALKGKGVVEPKAKPKGGMGRVGRGLVGGALGALAGGAIAGMFGPEFAGGGGAELMEAAGGAVGGIAGAVTGGAKVEPKVEPKIEPKVEPKADPRYKFNERTGRFHDTMKGVGGGEMISNAKAKELGLEKPVTEELTKTAEKTEAKVAEKTVAKVEAKTTEKVAEKVVADTGAQAAKTAAQTVEKTGAKEAVQKGGSSAVKEAVAKLGPKFAKGLVKAVPFVGALAGLAFAISRATEGDWKGAAAEAASGGASVFAGPGTAASVALDVGLLVRDVYKAVHGKFPDDDPEFSQEKLTEVKTAVTDYVSSLLPQSEDQKKEEEKAKTNPAPPPPAADANPKIEPPSAGNITPGVTPDISGVMMSANETTQKGKVEKPTNNTAGVVSDLKQQQQKAIATGEENPNYLMGVQKPVNEGLAGKGFSVNPDAASSGPGYYNDQLYKMVKNQNTEPVKKADAKAQMLGEQQQPTNQAPIIINKQGDVVNQITNNNNASGGSSGGVGSPSRVPSPWDAMTLGKSWEAYP